MTETDPPPAVPGSDAPPFTLRQLQIFLAVADAGSFSAAAERLLVSQTAVSLAVTELERVLRTTLLVRRRAQGVQLTTAGRSVLPLARTVLRHSGALYEQAAGAGELRGTVSLGCFPSLGPSLLPGLLEGFLTAHPAADVRFREAPMDRLEPEVLSGSLDLALTFDVGLHPDLERTRLATRHPGVLLPAEHPAARASGPLDLRTLAQEPFISLDTPLSSQHVDGMFRAAGIVPRVRYRSESFETVRSLVGRGFGWAVTVQRSGTDRTHEGRRVVVREIVPAQAEPVAVVAAWSAAVPLSRTARAFVDLARSAPLDEQDPRSPRHG
ncbi:LysR family transcriptional regulator [Kocuria sp. M1R5S2]|uniref:LysR family transcriptional regulator n=1 Tax=Kocuria rhizosphaerae TaxID=3376285 RepID=UPI0037B66CCE